MTSTALAGHPGVVGSAPALTHLEVRSLRCSPPPSADTATTADGAAAPWARLVRAGDGAIAPSADAAMTADGSVAPSAGATSLAASQLVEGAWADA
jgi:hypothetical protein